jgi:hypothetical protein
MRDSSSFIRAARLVNIENQEDAMSHQRESFESTSLPTRREFTLDAALTVLAGCIVTISDACGKSTTEPTSTPTDVSAAISSNHNHSGVITGAQITAGTAFTLNIQGTAAHPHTISITQGDLTALKNRQTITRESSIDPSNTFGNHSHQVTFAPM